MATDNKPKDAFTANPNAEKYYVTADNQCFEKEHDAVQHARTLASREVKSISRKDVLVDVSDKKAAAEKAAAEKAAAEKAAAEKAAAEKNDTKENTKKK